MSKNASHMIFIVLLTIFCAIYCFPPETRPTSKMMEAFGANPLSKGTQEEGHHFIDSLYEFFSSTIHMGLDLVGGAELRYQIDPSEIQGTSEDKKNEVMDNVKNVIEARIKDSGIVQEPIIRREGKFNLLVQLPGLTDQETEEVKHLITKIASLKFRLVAEDSVMEAERQKKTREGDKYQISPNLKDQYKWYKTKTGQDILLEECPAHPDYIIDGKVCDFNGSRIDSINRSFDKTGQPVPVFTFFKKYHVLFGNFTEKHMHRNMAIVHNNEVASYPEIQSRIEGEGIITGMSFEEVEEIITLMKSGSLEIMPSKIGENKVGPSLGEDAISQAWKAGALSAGVVIFFMIGYYHGCGLIALFSVAMNVLLVFTYMCLSGATLTLPGIGGIILSLGMAVDGSVLIFERIREERANNKGLRQSIEAGFDRAHWAIMDSNITTLITAGILYYFGSGAIQGFAVTLSAGVIFNLFTTLYIIRIFLYTFLENNTIKEIRMSQWFKQPNIDFMGMKGSAFAFSGITILLGIMLFIARGNKNFGIDFNGGVLVQIAFKPGSAKTHKEVTDVVTNYVEMTSTDGKPKYFDAEIQSITTEKEPPKDGKYTQFLIRTKNLKQEDLEKVRETIRKKERELSQLRGAGTVDRFKEEDLVNELKKLQEERQEIEKMDYLTKDLLKMFRKDDLVPEAFSYEEMIGEGDKAKVMLHVNLLHEISKSEALRILEKEANFATPEVILLPKPAEGELEKSLSFQMTVTATSIDTVKKEVRGAFARAKDYPLSSPFVRTEQISGVVAKKQKQDAVIAIFFSLIALILYIAVRFEWKYGVAAVIGLAHNVLFTLGAVAFGKYTGYINVEIDLSVIAAFLTIVGYSINDTIVVFDRIRENLVKPRGTFPEIVNLSLNQTLSRTMLTGLTTILSIVILFVINKGHSGMLEGFSYTMLVGVVIGTYSSVFIASSLLVIWTDSTPEAMAKLAKKERPPLPPLREPHHPHTHDHEHNHDHEVEAEMMEEEDEKSEASSAVPSTQPTSENKPEANKPNNNNSGGNGKKKKKKKKK